MVINNGFQISWNTYIPTVAEKPTITYSKSFTNCYGVISRCQDTKITGSYDIHTHNVTNTTCYVVKGGAGVAVTNIDKGLKFIIFAYGKG